MNFFFQMSVALNSVQWQTVYPMDFYANDSLGAWTNNNEAHRPVRQRKSKPVKIISEKGSSDSSKKVIEKDEKDTKTNEDSMGLISDKVVENPIREQDSKSNYQCNESNCCATTDQCCPDES